MTDAPPPPKSTGVLADRQALQRLFIVLLALGVSAVFLWMIRGYLGALFLAGVLAMFLMPLQTGLARLLFGWRNVAASLVLIIAIFVVLIPLISILIIVADQAVEVSGIVIPWVQGQVAAVRAEGMAALPEWLPFRDSIAPYQADITGQIAQLASSVGGLVVDALRGATSGTLGAFLNLVVLLFALFFFLTRGREIAQGGLRLLPLPAEDRALLAERALSTIRATVKGTFVIAIIQGTLTGAALAVAGVPGAVFWGTVTVVLSVIPGIGPPLVWGPAGIWLIASGDYVAGGALIAWGALVIGVIDNLLRPRLVGQDAKLPDLMILVSTLGGLALFGPIGLIVGPVIAALFAAVWYLYAQSYAPLLGDPQPGPTDQTRSISRRRSDP